MKKLTKLAEVVADSVQMIPGLATQQAHLIQKLSEENAQLKARVAELEKEGERLSWCKDELLSACKHALKQMAFADPTNQPSGRPAPDGDQGCFVHLEEAICAAEGI